MARYATLWHRKPATIATLMLPEQDEGTSGPPSEREKWEAETAFRHREIALKEREQTNRETELHLKRAEQASSNWRSPVVVAILTAAVAAAGNAIVTSINGREQRILEKQRSEQARILEMVKTGNPDKAAENLLFLVDAGLIADDSIRRNLSRFLATRKPGSGPTLPAESGVSLKGPGIVGTDDAKPVDALPEGATRQLAQAIGQLVMYNKSGTMSSMTTAFLVGPDLLLTAGFALNESTASAQLRLTADGREKTYSVILPPLEQVNGGMNFGYALMQVKGRPGATWGYLPLASSPPVVNQALALIMFRQDKRKLVVAGTPDCRVMNVSDSTFSHLCDTGPGSGGAALLSADGRTVVGIHLGRTAGGASAVRADLIRNVSHVL